MKNLESCISKRFSKTTLVMFGGLMIGSPVFGQTTVNSLTALLPYLDDNNANVKLAAGNYTIRSSDVANGTFGSTRLVFSGSNSTFDFTGVTLNISADVYDDNHGMNHLQILGNNNVLKNLKMVDLVGKYVDNKREGGVNITMDGSGNRIEGFHVTVSGSYPYGYGDAFGKGGTNNTIGHKKHSACLVRGESNHVKNCTFIHRSYGHCIFMQAASNPVIEGCYVEGEMRSTDEMLAEQGTGSPADEIDFLTTWGYTLPAGYMMSTGEEGIRAYNGGTTTINGVTYVRGTSNPTVVGCTVKYMRGGVTLAHASGSVYVEDCTAIGCEQGFGIGSGTAINCKADVSHGHLFKSTYDNDSWDLDIELIPAVDPYYNGQKCIAFIGMDNSDIEISGNDPNLPSSYRIQIGGTLDGVRFKNGSLANQSTHDGMNNMILNHTSHPLVIASGSSGNTGESAGTITDNGSGNSIEKVNGDFGFTPDPNKTYYIDCPYHNLRLAATGSSEDAYTTSTSTTGADVEWKFVDKGNGYWHLDRAAGGSTPRLRTDNSANADMQSTSSSGSYTYYGFSAGSSSGTHFLTLADGPSNYRRLQINSSGEVKMVTSNHSGTWESFTITEAGGDGIVNIIKRNAQGYAIDGGNGGTNGQNVYLWGYSSSNVNQQWEEIDRGNGYYSYQKKGTNFSLDGGNGGASGQNVYLWTTSANNYNQHWQKVDKGNGFLQLRKRNSTGYAINGGSGGANGQNVNLYDSSHSSQNLQWKVEE